VSAADTYKKKLGQEIADLLGDEFTFYKSKLMLKRKRASGFDVIILAGSNKWSPLIDVSFYFGRNFDNARKVEKALNAHPMPYQIQQYSPNVNSMLGLDYSGDGNWEVNIEESSQDVAIKIKSAIEKIAFPFFERFTTLEAAQEALTKEDSWCFSPKGPFYHMLFNVDAALGDLEHFKKWSKCLDNFYIEQVLEKIAILESSGFEI
jgi:hypothetical protein